MRSLSWLAASAIVASVTTLPLRSTASTVVTKATSSAHVSEARLAFSSSKLRTVAFEQLVLDEASGDVVWIIPIPKGGAIELGNERVFEAFDQATAPVVVPAKSLGCPDGSQESEAGAPLGVAPLPVVRVLGSGTISALAAEESLTKEGFVVDETLKERFAALDKLGEDVALVAIGDAKTGATPGPTKVVRVYGPSARALPTLLPPHLGPAARLRAFVISAGRSELAGAPTVELDFTRLAWASTASNYPALLDEARFTATPGAALVFSARDGLLVDQPAGAAGETLPSFTRRYFGAQPTCVARVESLSTSAKIVGPTCPKTTPWGTPTGASCTAPTPEEIQPSELSCGTLDDLAAALGGLSPATAWVTRFEAIAGPIGAGVQPVALPSIPSFHEARLGDGCGMPADPTSTPTPTGAPATPSGSGDGTSSSSGSSSAPNTTSEDDGSGPSPAAEGCAAALDSCSASSSSSSSDSCSGDSSSSGDSCSGDSSSGSEGCSGDSGGSSGGCSSGGSSDGCHVARGRTRLRLSPFMLALVAVATVLRRRGRPKAGASGPESGMLPSSAPAEERCPTTNSSSEPAPASDASSTTSSTSSA